MTAEPLVIIGAGGFGREVHDVVVAINQAADDPVWNFLGFLDDGHPDPDVLARRGAGLIGGTSDLAKFTGVAYVVGIGDPQVRERLAERADDMGLVAATLIHPSATTGLDVQIGPGSVVCSHTSITTNVRIGRHVHLDQNVSVGHDCRIDDYGRVNPGATISGDVHLERGVLVGTNAAVIQGLTVGKGAKIGAGAAVVRSVCPGTTVVGVPAHRR